MKKIIFSIVESILALWIIFFVIDFSKAYEGVKPLSALWTSKKSIENGYVKQYYCLGYKIIEKKTGKRSLWELRTIFNIGKEFLPTAKSDKYTLLSFIKGDSRVTIVNLELADEAYYGVDDVPEMEDEDEFSSEEEDYYDDEEFDDETMDDEYFGEDDYVDAEPFEEGLDETDYGDYDDSSEEVAEELDADSLEEDISTLGTEDEVTGDEQEEDVIEGSEDVIDDSEEVE